jgi:hypothetical protein
LGILLERVPFSLPLKGLPVSASPDAKPESSRETSDNLARLQLGLDIADDDVKIAAISSDDMLSNWSCPANQRVCSGLTNQSRQTDRQTDKQTYRHASMHWLKRMYTISMLTAQEGCQGQGRLRQGGI